MGSGIPLDDADRAGWLAALADLIRTHLAEGRSLVLACSALKQRYRDQLRVGPEVQFVYLRGSYDLILARMRARPHHYMKPEMLASQFATLEPPADALTVDIAAQPETLVEQIIAALA
jgi:gluconokinase